MGQIINQFPGGGEDVTAEVEVQTPLVDQIMTALIGKVGDDANATAETILEGYKAWVQGEKIIGSLDPETLKHGKYIWKAYVWEEEITVENPSFTGDVNNPSTNYIKITQSSFDKSLINDVNFFAGFDAGNSINKFDYDEGVVKYFWGTDSTQKWQVISYNPETGEILTGNAPYDGTFTFSYTGEKVLRAAQRGAFANYIVADAEDAYPNGGTQGGYYYEKMDFSIEQIIGITKMAKDTFAFASDTVAKNTTLTHSLGVAPRLVIVKDEKSQVGTSATYMAEAFGYMNKSIYKTGAGVYVTLSYNDYYDATESNIRFNTGSNATNYCAGVEYTMYTFA